MEGIYSWLLNVQMKLFLMLNVRRAFKSVPDFGTTGIESLDAYLYCKYIYIYIYISLCLLLNKFAWSNF